VSTNTLERLETTYKWQRKLSRVTWEDLIRNEDIRNRTETMEVVHIAEQDFSG